jgi:CubicO group peptidase (beta-lactamase class C family)
VFEVVDELAGRTGFSGVVRVDRAGHIAYERAFGLAHRAFGVPNTPDTLFAIASGVKGMTALTVLRLVEDGALALDTTARSLLGDDLPLIDPTVTVRHLLAHRSGIGDYLDESVGLDINDYAMPVPVHRLVTTADYLQVLDGHPMRYSPDERFEYCNGGFVVLALLAERATGETFHDLVDRCVVTPAAMTATAFLRSDSLPGAAAVGYLDGAVPGRTNVHHLPLRGSGDGGIYTTAADLHLLWRALFAGRIISNGMVDRMITPVSSPATASGSYDYGLGCWLRNPRHSVEWEGYDAGVSFRSGHDRASDVTYTVCSNTSEGAWPVMNELERVLGLAAL